MMEKMEKFIKKLGESDETTKRRWLFLTSGIAMFVVIFLWMNFFNPLAQPENAPQHQESEQGFAFWQTFRAGLGSILQTAGGAFQSLVSLFREPKSYIIQP